jgi:hypothetical protein
VTPCEWNTPNICRRSINCTRERLEPLELPLSYSGVSDLIRPLFQVVGELVAEAMAIGRQLKCPGVL